MERRCLLLLDEAANIAPARGLPQWAATARSHGITVASIWQDLAQIRAIYGDGAQTILNNHRARWFGTGLADDDALDYLSKLIGDTNTWERSWSTDLAPHRPAQIGSGGKRSINDSQTQRRAATADLLRRLQPGDGILIYGSTTPALVSLTPLA